MPRPRTTHASVRTTLTRLALAATAAALTVGGLTPAPAGAEGDDSLGPGGPGSGRQAAVHQPGHAGHLHRAGLRPVPRPRAVQDGRVAGGVAVPRRRHLHLGRLPRLPRPAQPHAHLDQHPADERLAPAADHARPAGQLPPRVPALRQRPGDQRQAQPAGPVRQGVPPGDHRGVDRGRRGAGARDRAGQHAVVRPRGVRRHQHHVPGVLAVVPQRVDPAAARAGLRLRRLLQRRLGHQVARRRAGAAAGGVHAARPDLDRAVGRPGQHLDDVHPRRTAGCRADG